MPTDSRQQKMCVVLKNQSIIIVDDDATSLPKFPAVRSSRPMHMHHVTSMTMLFFRTIVLFLLFGDGVLPSVHCEFTTLLFGTFSESFDNGISKMLALKQQTSLFIYCFVVVFELEIKSKSNVDLLFITCLNIKEQSFCMWIVFLTYL